MGRLPAAPVAWLQASAAAMRACHRLYEYTAWVLFKEPLLRLVSYHLYMALVYVLLGALLGLAALVAWMAWIFRSDEQERRRHKRQATLPARRPAHPLVPPVTSTADQVTHAATPHRPLRLLSVVRPAVGLLLVVFPVAVLDMLSGVFTCAWQEWPRPTVLLWPSTPGAHRTETVTHDSNAWQSGE